MIARGVTPDEKIYSLWLKKLTLQADIFDAMYTVSTRLNGFPNEFSKALVLEFLSREDQKYLNYIRNGIFQKGCFEEEYFAGVKTDPEFAEGALEIFLAKWKIDNNSDFIELFWNAVAGKYGQFSHFCSYTKGLAYYYKFLRKRSLLVHGEHALTHCKTVEEYTEILEYLWDKDIPLSLNTVNSVKFTGEAPVTQQLVDAMEELFASKKIGNFEELYCLHRLGQTPDYYLKIVGEEKVPVNMVPWLELYGKVRGLVLTDQVEDIMNSVDLAWPQDDEEPILPPGRFLYKFDLKDKEWEELKVKVEEYFSGEERPDIKLKKRSGLPNEWLVFYAFINKKIKKIVGRKGQGSKIKGSNSRKRPRRKKKK